MAESKCVDDLKENGSDYSQLMQMLKSMPLEKLAEVIDYISELMEGKEDE